MKSITQPGFYDHPLEEDGRIQVGYIRQHNRRYPHFRLVVSLATSCLLKRVGSCLFNLHYCWVVCEMWVYFNVSGYSGFLPSHRGAYNARNAAKMNMLRNEESIFLP